jgi:hypothetical protein
MMHKQLHMRSFDLDMINVNGKINDLCFCSDLDIVYYSVSVERGT